MKRIVFAIGLLVLPPTSQAAMDDLTFMSELSALATAIALEQECQVAIDVEAMMSFMTSHFAGRESDVLAGLDGQVAVAKFALRDASELQKKLLCATVGQYIAKHQLAPEG